MAKLFGLRKEGFKVKRLADIHQSLVERIKSAAGLGPGAITKPDDPLGQLIGVFAAELAEVWEATAAVYSSGDPDEAAYDALDNLSSLLGISREPAIYTRGLILCQGVDGTLIPAGAVARVPSGPRVITTQDGTIVPGGVLIPVRAENIGPVEILAGTVTDIVTFITGWEQVSNPDSMVTGRNIERDSELRQRRARSLSILGGSTDQGIRSDLEALDDVTAAIVISNRTETPTDSFGIPLNRFLAVVWPPTADPDDIAQVILRNQPSGIGSFGSELVIAEDDEGMTHPIRFSFAQEREVHVHVVMTYSSKYPSDGDDQAKNLVVLQAQRLSIGDDYILIDAGCAIKSGLDYGGGVDGDERVPGVPGIVTLAVYAKVGSAPTIPTDNTNIPISLVQIATVTSANVTITSTPA